MIDTNALLAAASDLRAALVATPLTLDLPGVGEARREADTAVDQLDDYVMPRLRDIDAPVLIVVGGSTGAGKSTLVNSLLGAEVTKPGVLRPTTRSPVLVHHPDSARWFEGDRILPGLTRVRDASSPSPDHVQLVGHPAMPTTLALLDAPDIDSVVDANRAVAAQLLDAADLWLFVTTAARYADAVPWDFLRRAQARGVGVALVLNRIPPGAQHEIGAHLSEMLARQGLGDAPVFSIEERPLAEGRLPDAAVSALRTWLGDLANDHHARAELVRRTLVGTVHELSARAERIAGAADAQRLALERLAHVAAEAFDEATWNIAVDVRDGTVMRGEVLARWQELLGTGELLRQLQSGIGRLRDRLASAVTRRPAPDTRFQGAVTSGVEQLVVEHAARAVDDITASWRNDPAGAALLDHHDELTRVAPDLGERTGRMVRDWQSGVVDLLRRESKGKQLTARIFSYGVNAAALVLMVLVFSQTGGLTGAEVAIAGGSSAVGQRLLEALLGDQAVRQLAVDARTDLEQRVSALLASERARFDAVLAGLPGAEGGDGLRQVAGRLRRGVAA